MNTYIEVILLSQVDEGVDVWFSRDDGQDRVYTNPSKSSLNRLMQVVEGEFTVHAVIVEKEYLTGKCYLSVRYG